MSSSYAETAATTEFRGAMSALYESWGILDLLGETVRELPPEWLRILNIARNLLDHADIPGVPLDDDLADFISRPEDERPAFRHRTATPRYVPPMNSDAVLRPMESLSDFPHIDPSDLALGQDFEDLFEYRLVSGEVNAYYVREMRPPEEISEDLEEEAEPPKRKTKRQKVYVLVDVSNSMRDHNKMVFAKALVLAYIIRAAEEGAQVYLRTFANTIHKRSDALDRESFPALAQRVLGITPAGGTDIKEALETAIQDIRTLDGLRNFENLATAHRTEILLVSDCESYSVPYIPDTVKLHTIHLRDGAVAKSALEGFDTIKAASRSFHEIDTTSLWLPDTTVERWMLKEDRLRLASGGFGPSNGDSEAKLTNDTLIEMYEKMERQGKKGEGAGRAARKFAPLRNASLPTFRHLWQAFLLLTRPLRLFRRDDPLAWKPVEHHSTPRPAVTFRTRR